MSTQRQELLAAMTEAMELASTAAIMLKRALDATQRANKFADGEFDDMEAFTQLDLAFANAHTEYLESRYRLAQRDWKPPRAQKGPGR